MALGLEELKILIKKENFRQIKAEKIPFFPSLVSPQRLELQGGVLPETLSPKSTNGTLILLHHTLLVSIASGSGAKPDSPVQANFCPKEEVDCTCFSFRHPALRA